MEFAEVVRRRRMVRNFSEEPLSADAVDRIVARAQHAPSAGFSQGQRLVVVTEASRRARVAELLEEPSYVEQGFDPWISRAPVLFVPCVSEEAYHRRYREPDKVQDDGSEIEWPVPYWWVDVGCTAMLVLLAAVDEGLAAGFAGIPSMEPLKSELGIPDEYTPIGVIPVGRPLPDVRSPSLRRGRVPIEDFAHRERW